MGLKPRNERNGRRRLASTTIRRATVDDAEVIARLGESVQQLHFEHEPESYKPPNWSGALGWCKQLLADPETAVFIAEELTCGPVGYVITKRTSTPAHAYKYAGEFVEIDQLGVSNGWRGRGVGRALHRHLVDYWTERGVREFRLTVIGFNRAARRYYEGLGFVEASRRMQLRLRQGALARARHEGGLRHPKTREAPRDD